MEPRFCEGDVGITPAHAGTTIDNKNNQSREEDHPRTRGDYLYSFIKTPSFLGSPPHTRGLHFFCVSLVYPVGITPAHAGTTILELFHLQLNWDHPRTRGDYALHNVSCHVSWGSPPHTRGLPLYLDKDLKNLRITPAHAGTTSKTTGIILSVQDHPRTRGDYS